MKKISLFGYMLIVFIGFSGTYSYAAKNSLVPKINEKVLKDIPLSLKDWKSWVIHDKKDHLCPSVYNNIEDVECFWPSRLHLNLNANGGMFSQEWTAYADGWVYLPGDKDRWPDKVKIDNIVSVITPLNTYPSVFLKKGKHKLSGSFVWNNLPEFLKIPNQTGLVKLKLNSSNVKFPQFDSNGRIWLQKRLIKEVRENTIDVKVYRLLTDSIPFKITTYIELKVSGESREEFIGPVLLAESKPVNIESQLPVKLEQDGRLLVQARPGTWGVTIESIINEPVTKLLPLLNEKNWTGEEFWSFKAQNHLRIVSITGPLMVDPNQTELPTKWKGFPTYFINKESAVNMIEKKRGDPEPGENSLSLKRFWWLDFDGKGYTIRDEIEGTLMKGWRLNMNPPYQLGHVSVSGIDQLITKNTNDEKAGVELRMGRLNLIADFRAEDLSSNIDAVSWDHDFQKVSGSLELPPGWKLFNVSGVDNVSGAWLRNWTLLDLFIVFM